MYYPKAKFIDDPVGREEIASIVPAGRLGTPEEFGELVEFYISGRSAFTTGQVINFTGGWLVKLSHTSPSDVKMALTLWMGHSCFAGAAEIFTIPDA